MAWRFMTLMLMRVCGRMAGTDGHARPIHTALLLFACVGLILDIAMFFLHSFYSSPLGAIMGGIACVFAMVGASVFLGTSCGDRCLRNPTGAQAIFWLLGISLALSLAAVIVAAVDLATIVCKTYKDYSYNSYGYSSSSSSSSWHVLLGLFEPRSDRWHLLLGLFTALGMWKTLPATNNMVCCSGNAGGAHAYA
ncbi:hypothetical protein T484DRAFT_1809803 [Baffinella frigidus]|nr:hypothetical protein T484DRAFT_1809803 [Cryptophyta sp. CCMP2293]